MHIEAPMDAGRREGSVDPWALLTGGSVATVAGFIADLLRLGAHQARSMIARRAAQRSAGDWPRPCTGNR